jgi:hypothetical protein
MEIEDRIEHPHVSRIKEGVIHLTGWAEVLLLGAAALALFLAALVVVGQGIVLFVANLVDRRYGVGLEVLLDRMLITMMVVEILDTVRLTISSRKLRCQPFLIVGMIAATRQILLITLKSSVTSASSPTAGVPDSFTLVGLVLVILGLAFSINLLKKSNIP